MAESFCYIFIKDVLTFIATFAGLIIASMGLATWKKQIKGTKEFDTAYELRYSILKLRDSIKHVRNPGIWPSESYRAINYAKQKYPDEPAVKVEENTQSYVYQMRWEEIVSALTEVESHLLAAEVLWGAEILDLVKPLNRKVTELNIALQQHVNKELRTQDYGKIRKVIYDHGSEQEPDDFSKSVGKLVDDIFEYIKLRVS